MWCFLSVFCLSTLHSINLWSCLPSSVFAWGQARSKLGGWYVHFASLFCIIIYCYSLLYFIFGGDTYVVSSVFTCLMIIGELAAGVKILLEKGPSRHHISEDQQFQRNIQKFIYYQKTKVPTRRKREEQQGGHTTRWRGPTPGRPPWGEATLDYSRHRPLTYMVVPKILSQGGHQR
jgi:hypothetical protein